MKKIYALFLALMVCAVSFAALNPYAYALSSSLSADETTLTVNYSLNADATEVNVVILNGEEVVKTIACEGITKGAYTVEVPTAELPKLATLTWKVEVKGNSVSTPTIQTNKYSFFLPSGLDVDVDPESPYLGRWYVIEAVRKSSNQIHEGYHSYEPNKNVRALYVFDATLAPIANKNGTYGFLGGLNWGATETNVNGDYLNFYRVATSGGRLFLGKYRDGQASIMEADPANLDANFTEVLNNGSRAVSIDVRGSGENLKLVMLDVDYAITEYDLGTAKSISAASRSFDKTGLSILRNDATIVYDNEGGIWLNQNRGTATATEATIANITIDGVKYNNFTAGLSHNGCNNSGIAINPEGTELAVVGAGTKKLTIYSISKDAEGKISLTQKYTISTAGSNHTALSYDYAGNLYVANRSAETITFYAMPYDGEVATPAASKYAFQLQGEIVGTFYDLTVNCDETEGKVEGNNGQYLENTEATLTAVANRGYKFASWTVGEETVTENPLTITINANTTVTANFDALAAYTITATANDATMGTIQGAGTYYAGETVTLKAVANDGHHFVNWSNEAAESTITFEAIEDVTLTANFAKNIYTLTVNVNNSEKGSVDKVTATYEYGTEVTLTATAADGCELLAWSDRSTAETLTITMDGNKAVTAYFVTSYVNDPEFKVEKVWENANVPAATANGYQAVGWDGVIYMQDKGNEKIKVISAEATTEYAASGAGQQIAVDQAGNLVVFNAYFATATPNSILIYKKGETEGKAVAFTLKDPAACHFFSASGDIFSAEGGYIYFYCNGKTAINRLKITNGAATEADVTTDLLGSIYQGNTQNHVMVDIWGNLVAHARSNAVNYINSITGESKAFTLPSIKMGTLGGCSFELAGKELWAYHAGATNYSSEWNIYNMTDAKFVSDEDFYIVDKAATTNYAANWLNVQVVDEKTAYIYQFCPLKGAAIWKVTANFVKPATPVIEVSEDAVMTITCETEQAVIYFDYNFEEFDGEVLVNADNKYEEAISLSTSDDITYQVEAIAVLDGEVSEVATATFEVKDGAVSVDLEAIGALAVVYSKDGQLYVQTEVGTMIEVYSLQGQTLYVGEAATDLTAIAVNEKVVLARVAGETIKVIIK